MELIFHCRAIETIRLGPDIMKGNRIRGGFGSCLKAVSCKKQELASCKPCQEKGQCFYFLAFDDNTPHPYVFKQVFDGKEKYEKNDIFSFNLVLTGVAINYMYRFIRAIELLGKHGIGQGRGRFEICDAWPEGHFEAQQFFGGRKQNGSDYRLNFMTPLCLTDENYGKYMGNEPFFFSLFVRSLILRIINLVNLYAEGTHYDRAIMGDIIKARIEQLAEIAEKIQIKASTLDWFKGERHPSGRKEKQPIEGFLGELHLDGDLSLFMPYLKIGEIVGAGSLTTMGFGRFEVVRRLRKDKHSI